MENYKIFTENFYTHVLVQYESLGIAGVAVKRLTSLQLNKWFIPT